MKLEVNVVKSDERLPELDGTYVVWWSGVGFNSMNYTVQFGWNTYRNSKGIVEKPQTSIDKTSIPYWLEIDKKQFEEIVKGNVKC